MSTRLKKRLSLAADDLQRDVPLGRAPIEVEHAYLVRRREFSDGQLGDLLLPAISVRHFRGVHEQDEAALALDLDRLDIAVNGKGLLHRGSLPSAGAEAVGPSDHDQPASLLVHVAPQHLLLIFAEQLRRDIGEDDAIVIAEKDAKVRLVFGQAARLDGMDLELRFTAARRSQAIQEELVVACLAARSPGRASGRRR